MITNSSKKVQVPPVFGLFSVETEEPSYIDQTDEDSIEEPRQVKKHKSALLWILQNESKWLLIHAEEE